MLKEEKMGGGLSFYFHFPSFNISCPGKVSGRGLASKQSNHYFLSKYFMSLSWEIFHVAGKYLESKLCFNISREHIEE